MIGAACEAEAIPQPRPDAVQPPAGGAEPSEGSAQSRGAKAAPPPEPIAGGGEPSEGSAQSRGAKAAPPPEPIAGGAEPSQGSALIDGLLSQPSSVVERALGGDAAAQTAMVRTLLLTILFGTAAFGAAVGFTRGGWQVLYAAIKLPIVVLITAAVSTPALTAVGAALGRPAALRRDLMLVLAALARASLVLACVRLDYHQAVVLLVSCCAVAGLAGLPLLGRALWAERRGRLSLIAAMLLVVVLGGTHTSWLFRPYLVRPRTVGVPFLRPLDGSFADSLNRSSRSARGLYQGDHR